MQYKEGVQDAIEYVLMYENIPLDNNTKRKNIYRQHIFERHGRLGNGVCVRVCPCIEELVRLFFPKPPNTAHVGFRET